MRIGIAQEVPGGTGPLRHGIGLALRGAAAAGTGGVDPVGHCCQRRFAVVGRHVGFHIGKQERQLFFRKRNVTAFFAFHDRDRFAPVTLAAEDPVTQFVIGLGVAEAILFQPGRDRFFRIGDFKAVQETAVDHLSGSGVSIGGFFDVSAGNDFYDRQFEFLCEFPVAFVMRRDSHDRTGAVAHEYVVGGPDRNGPAGRRIDGAQTFQLDAGLLLRQFRTLKVGFLGCGFAVGVNFRKIFDAVRVFVDERMLRRDDHIGGAEDGIRPRGIDAELIIGVLNGEIHFRTGRAADPVLLRDFDAFDVVHAVQSVDQLVGIGRDLQHPLGLHPADDFAAAALASAADDFFVRKTDLAGGAPVDGHLRLVGETCLEELQEDPLGPVIVFRISCIDLAVPVEGIAEAVQLLLEAGNVPLGHDARVDMVFDRVVFRGQAERVPAHRVQDIVAFHAALPRNDVKRGIGTRMPDVKPLARRVGELDKRVIFRFGKVIGGREGLFVVPDLLPFRLDLFGFVSSHHSDPCASFRK